MKRITNCLKAMKAKLPAATAEALRKAVEERSTGKKRTITAAGEIAAVRAVLGQEMDWRKALDGAANENATTPQQQGTEAVQDGKPSTPAPKTGKKAQGAVSGGKVAAVSNDTTPKVVKGISKEANAALDAAFEGLGAPSPIASINLDDSTVAYVDAQAETVRYASKTNKNAIGKLTTAEGPNGEIVIEHHHLDDELRGKGYGEKGVKELQRITGKTIISDQYPSSSARKMWERLGAVREKVEMAPDEIQTRYVLRPKNTLGAPNPVTVEQAGLPVERMGQFISAAQALIGSDITTPEALAAVLEDKFGGRMRKYSQAFWNAFGMVNPALTGTHDWNAIYAAAEVPAEQSSGVAPISDAGTQETQGTESAPSDNPASPEPGADTGSGFNLDAQNNPANVTTDERPLVQRSGSVETGDAGQTGEPSGAGAQSGGRMGGEQSGGTESTGDTGNAIADSGTGDGTGDGSGTESGGRAGSESANQPDGDLRDVRGTSADAGVTESQQKPVVVQDYTLSETELPSKFSQTDRYKKNVEAIKLLRKITAENRQATEAEKAVLVQYVGWGGLKNAFVAEKADWRARYDELKELLTPEEYAAARSSIRNAHYTSAPIIGAIWKAFRRFGFNGGKLIEGGSGLGHFWGLMPAELRGRSSYHGVEMDKITAAIAKLVYPKATIQNLPFQEAVLERNHFDASAGNPPFGNDSLFDKNHKEASKYSIHNFFIGKQIELLKEGGVGGWVVSHYFLDALDPSARKWIHEQAEFLGSVRLPNTAFKGNANTEVTTDIVFFRKRGKGEQAVGDKSWIDADTKPSGSDVKLNRWLAEHPKMMLGIPSMEGTMHAGREEFTLKPIPGAELEQQIDEAIAKLPAGVFGARIVEETQRLTQPKVEVADGLKVGSFFTKDGKIMRRTRDINGARQAEEYTPSSKARAERMQGMIGLRDLLNGIVRAELGDVPDSALDKMRGAMSKRYDEFVKKYGPLNSLGNRQAFNDDTDSARVFALERDYDPGISDKKAKETGVPARKPSAKKADIFTRRVNVRYEEVTTAATPADAMWVSLNQRGTVDIPYMAKLTGMSEADVIEGAGELIYEDPKAGWQYREKYLSGNVRQKLADAEKALAANGGERFERNVDALKKAMPADISPMDIRANLGAGWIPSDVVASFIETVLEGERADVIYIPELGRWSVSGTFAGASAATYDVMYSGGGRKVAMGFDGIINSVLNSKAFRIYERVDKDTTVFDAQATTQAEEKASQLRERFRDWLMMDEARRTRLHRLYNDTMNNFVDPKHTGHHLTLPGLANGIELRPHQKSVVARTIAERTVFFDHVVGAGKTFAGIASFMEMKRLGLVKKALFAVPNHLTMQWRDDFIKLYPNANVLYATPADFAKDKRQKLFAKIMTGDWDAVILGHSSLKKLGVAAETEAKMFNEMLEEITAAIEQMRREQKAQDGKKIDSRFIAQMEKTRDSIAAKLQKAQERVGQRDEAVNFEEMGFDGLFVDESHEFKNLFSAIQCD